MSQDAAVHPRSRTLMLLLSLPLGAACADGAPPGDGVDAGTGTPDAARDAPGLDAAVPPADAGGGSDGSGLDAGAADAVADRAMDGRSSDAGSCAPDECCYRHVLSAGGQFHSVTEAAPQHVVRPLVEGEGFYCLRVEYTMHAPDNLAETADAHEGCPIFSHIGTVQGSASEGRVLGTAYFRFLRRGCPPRRPGAVELNAWNEHGGGSGLEEGPWVPGGTYRVVQEIEPFTSTVTLYDESGDVLGPSVTTDISGATVASTRGVEIAFGLDRIYENAFFPYFGATYRDLEVWADVAAPM